MFIARGQPVHENLATRYLLVDALIEDLCDESFAGVVQVTLPGGDYRVLLDAGRVVAVVERQDDEVYTTVKLAILISGCRAERGSVSIYSYPGGLALILAKQFSARPLYVNLSAEFADLEKLIAKLIRETDRKWFVEVKTGEERALIYIVDGTCTLIQSDGAMAKMSGQTTADLQDSALNDLIVSCHTKGGLFDVLFLQPGVEDFYQTESSENLDHQLQRADLQDRDSAIPTQDSGLKEEAELPPQDNTTKQPASLLQEDSFQVAAPPMNLPDASETEFPAFDILSDEIVTRSTSPSPVDSTTTFHEPEPKTPTLPTRDLMAAIGNNREVLEALKMAEIKRLLGKVLKTVEDAVRIVDQRETFNLHLRAAQLKIADRFPFLDPFGSEFEYLDGEIAFIGQCNPDDFVRGLTETLKIAITETAQASTKPVYLRTFVAENLDRLLETNRQEFELYKLDAPINEIIGRGR